ncbi:hypothetical protein NHX12_009006 [Muraenolepis orangiensis]|uniref:S-arrestin n=1 Tax=Muraenolepis orangiensis TaxID=630683 RepID=A0A9Q0DME5_9TELE|nr:hypothetical protein NHX12_009006 [Muraenolepis orangiensis]
MVACTFRYGRQDMDVMGMGFRRDVYLSTRQVYPPLQDRLTHSPTQDKILRKLGDNAYPFFFEFPDNLPCSKCAVEFEVKAFCAESQSDITKENIKDISISIEQVTNIVLYSNDKYVKSVAKEETSDCVSPGTVLRKEYSLLPLLDHNQDRRGIALDGKLKHQDTNLASSSIVKEEVLKEVQGILVSYMAVARMRASGEVSVKVPFRLMNPKPEPAELVFEEFKRDFLKGVIGEDDG